MSEVQYSKPSQSEAPITPAKINTMLNFAVSDAKQCAQMHRPGIYPKIESAVGIFTLLYNETFLEVKEHMTQEDYDEITNFIMNPLADIDWGKACRIDPEKIARPQLDELAIKIYNYYLKYQVGLREAKFRNNMKSKIQ